MKTEPHVLEVLQGDARVGRLDLGGLSLRAFYSAMTIFSGRIALLLALALDANAQTGQVFFQTTTFGIVGLSQNQVARLNVLNPGNPYDDHNAVCSGNMAFLDDQGHELKSSTAQVEWGKAVSLELDGKSLPNGAPRVQIRAVVKSFINRTAGTSPVMPGAVCSFMPTLEIFDKDTGKTVLIMSEGRSIILNTPANKPAKPPTQ